MPKYKVYGKFTAYVSKIVEAETPEDAVEKAADEFGGIHGKVGNGGYEKMIAVDGRDEALESEYPEIEWETPEEECE